MENIEKVYIIQPRMGENCKELHDEAVSLIESAGAAYCGTTYQTIKQINPATYFGSGKLAHIRELLRGLDDVTVLFNGSLSPSQTLNISAALDGRKVIDRTTLILDIFASRATSGEGKIQVELAQLKYIYPRLKGKGAALSRLGGGIGSRGPGETQLETDRRHIRNRIKYLEARLDETEQRRKLTVERRAKNNIKTIALVGYTNTGKSTLMNRLSGAGVLEKDALFATLDPTARKITVDGMDYILVDTVGFLQDLPHDLVEAFKSTLESALNCELALIVCDATGNYDMQFKTTMDTLGELGFDRPYIKVLNKCENIEDITPFTDFVCISAKFNLGIGALERQISDKFKGIYSHCLLVVPYSEISAFSAQTSRFTERSRWFDENGLNVECTVEKIYLPFLKQYIKSIYNL